MNYRQEIQRNREYWDAVLGERICAKILAEGFPDEREDSDICQEEPEALRARCEQLMQEETGWGRYPSEGIFGNFYCFFGRLAVEYAGKIKGISEDNLKSAILENYYRSVVWIPMRVLIREIHFCKEKEMLRGADAKEEYRDYQERFLNNRLYIRKLCEQYPEMRRLLLHRIVTVTGQIRNILLRMTADFDDINARIFPGTAFREAIKIECGLSDAHDGGQTVAKVLLDNGKILFYKPRNVEKDIYFMDMYGKFCGRAGLSFQGIRILARGDYGWESCAVQRPCGNEAEVSRYFKRMGVLLFLCRLLDMSDMHEENIVAMGEYPIPVDLETLPGCPDYSDWKDAEQMIREELKRSVLSTGILPVAAWGNNGKGVILNALHRGETIKAPFKVPVICEPESSEIHIAYRYGEKELSGSLPVCKGHMADPTFCVAEITEGFRQAYEYFLEEREQIAEDFAPVFSGKSRCMIRHTQQYQMYLRTSFYPEFLECGMRRRLFLHILDKDQSDEELAKQEREALYRMDIPVFYQRAAYESWKKKRSEYCADDLEKQVSLIELSLGTLEKRKFVRPKKESPDITDQNIFWKERVERQVRRIADKVCGMAHVTEGGDIGFWEPCVEENGNFRIAPAGISLYEGLGGIAVFLAEVIREYPENRYHYIFELTVKKLIHYTEEAGEKTPEKKTVSGGALLGEGSVIFTYILLHETTGEKRFLAEAERHAELTEMYLEAECCMDYLSGLSGIIAVWTKLYRSTKKRRYLETAVRAGEKVWECCERTGSGAGWRGTGKVPLAGMAHGNSGLLLAFACLLEITQDSRYRERIGELLVYEDSLYENGNWKDLRHPGGLRLCNNAWCHGAAGILLSRSRLKQCGCPEFSDATERDLERCRRIFLEDMEAEELCLCHGLSGNYLVLGQYLRTVTDPELEREQIALGRRIVERLEKEELSARERYNPSLMTGITGIGYALCDGSPRVNLLG